MTGLLRVTQLRRRYGNLNAVDGVDLSIDTGARHALIGCNGAGKSTMLHLIAGTVRVSSGNITYSGRNITRAAPAVRARAGIARTFQTPALLDSLSALDNVLIAAHPRSGRRWFGIRSTRSVATRAAFEQLDSLGIGACAHSIAGQLSHGRRRLLELAVALASKPRLLLLDEPAAGLTDDDITQLLTCIKGLPVDLAILLVEHHQGLVTAVADTVTVLHDGKLLAQGTPAQIAADPQVIEAYLGTGAANTLAKNSGGDQ